MLETSIFAHCELQALSREYGVRMRRYVGARRRAKLDVASPSIERDAEKCILCGRCVRMCEEQMVAKAIGFAGRGESRRIGTPFDRRSEVCRTCGGCMYVCPACELRCTYTEPDKAICGGCANLAPPCIEKETFDDLMCSMKPCVACEIPRS